MNHDTNIFHALQRGGDEHDHGDDHGHGIAKYIYVFLTLCVLTGASFFTYSEWFRTHFSTQTGWMFMMAVSCTKAMLVILFFMHVKYEANWKYVLTIPASMMAMVLLFALVPDVGLRTWWYSEERSRHAAEPTDREVMRAASHEAAEENESPVPPITQGATNQPAPQEAVPAGKRETGQGAPTRP